MKDGWGDKVNGLNLPSQKSSFKERLSLDEVNFNLVSERKFGTILNERSIKKGALPKMGPD